MTFDEAIAGTRAPEEIIETLTLIGIPFLGFDGEEHLGQMVVHEAIADDVRALFEALLARRFPIQSITPVVAFDWDDNASMSANNTSAFNFRPITGSGARLSNHALGRAIDINPLINPYVGSKGTFPAGAVYDPGVPGAVTQGIAILFKERGFSWGGDWADPKDWQHFEKSS